MTSTLDRRPLARPEPPARRPAPDALLPGAVAAGWALGAGLIALAVPVLLAWATDSRSGSGAADAMRAAGQLWLLAHGTTLAVPGGVVGLTPLGLLVLPLALLHRAGRHAARTAPPARAGHALTLAVAVAFPYAVAAGFLTALCATDEVRPSPGEALLGAGVVALLGAGSGIARETGLLPALRRLPVRVRRLARATAVALALLLAGGAVVAGASFAVHAGRAASLAGATDPGLLGGLTLFLLGVALVPNAVVWGAAFAAGPGFAVGVGTAVTPWATTLGPVPALPLLAGLPGGDVPLWVALGAQGLPVVAGGVAGWVVARQLHLASRRVAAAEAALVGPCVAAACVLLAWLSGGPLGGARLSDVGPSPWQVGLAVLLEVALPAAAVAALAVRRRM